MQLGLIWMKPHKAAELTSDEMMLVVEVGAELVGGGGVDDPMY